MSELLNIQEAAEHLRSSVSSVRRWVASGQLFARQRQKNGKLWFYKEDLELFLDRKKPVIIENLTELDNGRVFDEAAREQQAIFEAFIGKIGKM